jgi:hypothetical protein
MRRRAEDKQRKIPSIGRIGFENWRVEHKEIMSAEGMLGLGSTNVFEQAPLRMVGRKSKLPSIQKKLNTNKTNKKKVSAKK